MLEPFAQCSNRTYSVFAKVPGLFSDSILFLEEILLPLFQVHCQTQKQRKVEFNKERKLIIFIQLGFLVVLLVSSENLTIKSLHEKK